MILNAEYEIKWNEIAFNRTWNGWQGSFVRFSPIWALAPLLGFTVIVISDSDLIRLLFFFIFIRLRRMLRVNGFMMLFLRGTSGFRNMMYVFSIDFWIFNTAWLLCFSRHLLILPLFFSFFFPEKDGYHELHNEPNGVKDRFIDECISWVEARLPSSSVPSPAQKEDSVAATTAKL